MRHKTIGNAGLMLSVVLMLAMSAAGFLFIPRLTMEGDMGLFLPSPNLWNVAPWISWAIDNSLIVAVAVGLVLLNKHFNFIKNPDPVAPAIFLFMAGSNIWVTSRLGASGLLLVANFICLCVLFGCYRKENSTQDFFTVATIIALGSMIQYAFLLMIPVYLIAGFLLNTMRFKEILAFLIGLVAPYWVGFGFGIISPMDFTMPELSGLFSNLNPATDMFVIILNIGVTMVVGILVGLNCLMKLYAGNSRILALNNVVSLLGLFSCAGIILDFNNMPAYLATFYLAASVQLANMFALWPIKRSGLLLQFIALVYIAFFIATLAA